MCYTTAIMFYYTFLKKSELSTVMLCALLINIAGNLLMMMFTTGHTFGLSPFLFMMIYTAVGDTIYFAFIKLPPSVLAAKLIP